MAATAGERVPPLHWAVAPLAGLAAWVGWALLTTPTWTEVLLLGSPFVVVPLGLRAAARPETGTATPGLGRLATLAPLVAVSAAASVSIDPGAVATIVAVPWLAFTVVVATVGATRALCRRTLWAPGISVDVGLVFLAVGGVWLVLSRAGANPVNFGDTIVALTAVHFHYAGFALPIVAGIVAGRSGQSAAVPVLVLVGVPLTALGITVGGTTEWVGATTMAVGGVATAWLLITLATSTRGPARPLLAVAGMALLGGMALALGWAWSRQFGWEYLDLDAMARFHGSLNAIGFGIVGLIGLNLSATRDASSSDLIVSLRKPTDDDLEALVDRLRDDPPSSATDLLHSPEPAGYHHASWSRTSTGDELEAGRSAIEDWAGHRRFGVVLWPPVPPVAVDTVVGLTIPLGPMWLTAACRITEVVDGPGRYGFTYATLDHHPEDGSESFLVERAPDGSTTTTIAATSRPGIVAGRLVAPINRRLQARAVQLYLDGLTGAGSQP